MANNGDYLFKTNEAYMNSLTEEQIKQEQYDDFMGVLMPSVALIGIFAFILVAAVVLALITPTDYGGYD